MQDWIFTVLPKSDVSTIQKQSERRVILGKVLCLFSLLMLLSVVGLFQTFESLIESFQQVTLSGAGDPSLMAGEISKALVHQVVWLFFAIPGWLCCLLAIFFSSYRSSRYYYVWVASSIIFILSVPLGSLSGLILALVLFFKRKEF